MNAPRLLILAALASTACTPQVPETAPGGAPEVMVRPVSYVCEEGRSMITAHRRDNDTMTIIAGGLTKVLPAVSAASGARFADGGFEFWSHGEEASLTGFPGGPYTGCKEG